MVCNESPLSRVELSGKFFRLSGADSGKFYIKGFSYGPFADNSRGEPLPEPAQVCWLYLIQPIVRGWTRHTHLLRQRRLPAASSGMASNSSQLKRISSSQWDLYWDDGHARGREHLLAALSEATRRANWSGDFEDSWSTADIKLVGDRWHEIEISTASEELGWPRRFTRARSGVRPTLFTKVVVAATVIWTTVALISAQSWSLGLAVPLSTLWLFCLVSSRHRCLVAATEFVARAGSAAGLGTSAQAAETTQSPFEIAPMESVDSRIEAEPDMAAGSRP